MNGAIYTDGGLIGRNPSVIGGTWAWCYVENDERISQASGVCKCNDLRPAISSNMTELMAITKALEARTDGWSGMVYSDSQMALGWAFWGYKRDLAIPILCNRIDAAIARLGHIRTVLLDGHPTKAHLATGIGKRGNPVSIFNKFCDEECTRIGREYAAEMDRLRNGKQGQV